MGVISNPDLFGCSSGLRGGIHSALLSVGVYVTWYCWVALDIRARLPLMGESMVVGKPGDMNITPLWVGDPPAEGCKELYPLLS